MVSHSSHGGAANRYAGMSQLLAGWQNLTSTQLPWGRCSGWACRVAQGREISGHRWLIHLWTYSRWDPGHSQRVSPSAPVWSGKEDIRVLRRCQRDKFSLSKNLCAGAAFQCCLVTRQFAGFWLHGLMIVPTLYLLNFLTPSGTYLPRVKK